MKKVLLALLACLMLLFVGCTKEPDEVPVDLQKELDNITKNLIIPDNENLTSNIELFDTFQTIYTVTWEVEGTKRANITKNRLGVTMLAISRPGASEGWEGFTLKATVSDGTLESTKEISCYIRPLDATIVDTNIAGVFAAEKEATVKFSGTVYSVMTKGFWVFDETGYMYVYLNSDPAKADILLGDEVTVIGTRTAYYSMIEIGEGCTVLMDKYGEGTYDLKDMAVEKTIEELLEMADDNTKYGTIYKIAGTIVDDPNASYSCGIKSYYSNSAVTLYDSNMSTDLLNEVKGLKGKYVEMLVLHNDKHSNGYYRFVPIVGSIKEAAEPKLSDREKVDGAKSIVSALAGNVYSDMTLPTSFEEYADLTVVWATSNAAVLSAEGNFGTSENTNEEVTLTATVTCGDITETVDVKVMVWFITKSTINEANALIDTGAEETVWIEGKIIGLDAKSERFFVADETGVAYIYTKITDPKCAGLAVGDSVKIIGNTVLYFGSKVNQYTREITINSISKLETEVKTLPSVSIDLVDLAINPVAGTALTDGDKAMLAASKYQGYLYEIVGYVKVITSGDYTNTYIAVSNEDGAANVLYHYSSANQDAIKEFDGKLVKIIAPMFDYAIQYGWRIGSYISIEELTEAPADLTGTHTAAEVVAASDKAAVKMLGTVLFVYGGNGFFMQDETGVVFVYNKNVSALITAGDKVLVTGEKAKYNGLHQISNATEIKLVEYGVVELNSVVLSDEEFLGLDASVDANYAKQVTITGKFVQDGNYINFMLNDDVKLSAYMDSASQSYLKDNSLLDKEVSIIVITYGNKEGAWRICPVVTSATLVTE